MRPNRGHFRGLLTWLRSRAAYAVRNVKGGRDAGCASRVLVRGPSHTSRAGAQQTRSYKEDAAERLSGTSSWDTQAVSHATWLSGAGLTDLGPRRKCRSRGWRQVPISRSVGLCGHGGRRSSLWVTAMCGIFILLLDHTRDCQCSSASKQKDSSPEEIRLENAAAPALRWSYWGDATRGLPLVVIHPPP